jgi:hypothetical protein
MHGLIASYSKLSSCPIDGDVVAAYACQYGERQAATKLVSAVESYSGRDG